MHQQIPEEQILITFICPQFIDINIRQMCSLGQSLPEKLTTIIQLAAKNHQKVHEYFTGSIPDLQMQQIRLAYHLQQLSDPNQSDVVIPPKFLHILQYYLKQIQHQMSSTFENKLCQGTEYNFMRNLWAGHRERMRRREGVSERIDGINQVVSMLKLRTRQLTHSSYRQMLTPDYHDEIPINNQKQLFFQHPLIQKIQQELSSKTLELQQKSQRLLAQLQKNHEITDKNSKLQKKVSELKEKNKKCDKTIFELTKKKVGLEKKMFDMENRGNKENHFNNSNQQNVQMKKSIQLDNSEIDTSLDLDTSLRMLNAGSLTERIPARESEQEQMVHRFKNMRKLGWNKKRMTTEISPNTSIDSIKTLKFQRTSSKKCLMRGNKLLQKSVLNCDQLKPE